MAQATLCGKNGADALATAVFILDFTDFYDIGGKDPPENLADKGGIAMEQTFTLTITGTEHWEWQGRLSSNGNTETSFQSLLELIKQLNNELEKNATRENGF